MEVIIDFRRIFPPVMDRFYDRSKEMRHVSDIMSQDVITVEPDANMGEAARIMGEKHIGSLIVVENGKPLGIVTERDLLSDVIAKGSSPKNVKVEAAMSLPLITINPVATIKEAAQTMIKKKGRLAVFARVMGEERIGSVVVIRGGNPVGIFTERDLLTTFLAKGRELSVPVGEVCSMPLYVIPSTTPVNVTAYVMSSRRIKRLPVVEDDKMIGIITARDLVEAYAK
jgi:CBS domain-containing protein